MILIFTNERSTVSKMTATLSNKILIEPESDLEEQKILSLNTNLYSSKIPY